MDNLTNSVNPSSLNKTVGGTSTGSTSSASTNVVCILPEDGVRTISPRCDSFDMTDVKVIKGLGGKVARIPAYPPYALAEHTAPLMLTLNRKVYCSTKCTRE
jgi:D-lactate dehydrogenase